jgi:ribonuclease PH
MVRADGRADDELRPVSFTRGFQTYPAGSVLTEFGGTKVLCAASVTHGVPPWRRGSGLGWLTAEYAMLPSATHERNDRESVKGRVGGRTHEISRLIGRSLRACVDLAALGENTIAVDCDVLQADGGTRTAAITGAYVALADAVAYLRDRGLLADPQPLSCQIAAVSVGVVGGRVRLDLPYEEDARAEVDMNVVATDVGTLVEVQGTAEGATFARRTLDAMLDSALAGIAELAVLQREALAVALPPRPATETDGAGSSGGSSRSTSKSRQGGGSGRASSPGRVRAGGTAT